MVSSSGINSWGSRSNRQALKSTTTRLLVGRAALIADIRVVFPVPHPPKMPTANRGSLSLMIVARPRPMSWYPSAGDFVGESSRIFIPGTGPSGAEVTDMVLLRHRIAASQLTIMARDWGRYRCGHDQRAREPGPPAHGDARAGRVGGLADRAGA